MLLLFFLVWIIFNGNITLEIVLFGIVIAAVIFAFMCKFMNYSFKKERLFYKKFGAFCRYVFLLVKEIIKANFAVCKLIVTRKALPEPAIVRVHTNLKTDTAKVLLANSITLTPGTITVSLSGQELIVHCLDKTMAEGMEGSDFVKILEEMEREAE